MTYKITVCGYYGAPRFWALDFFQISDPFPLLGIDFFFLNKLFQSLSMRSWSDFCSGTKEAGNSSGYP